MDLSIKKLHFRLFKYILSRPYPFDHWLLLLASYFTLWFYSIIVSSILCFIVGTTFFDYLKFYFVINFFLMIYIVFSSYKLKNLYELICDTIDQIFRMTIGRLFGLKPIDYNYKQIDHRKNYGKDVLDFYNERSKIFTKQYEQIDFLVLNDYITIEEGNKKTDELLKKEYGYGFLVTLDGHYYTEELNS